MKLLYVMGNVQSHLLTLQKLVEHVTDSDVEVSILYTGTAFGDNINEITPVLSAVSKASAILAPSCRPEKVSGLRCILGFMRFVEGLDLRRYEAVLVPNINNIRNYLIARCCNLYGVRVIELQDGLYPGGWSTFDWLPWQKMILYFVKKIVREAVFKFALVCALPRYSFASVAREFFALKTRVYLLLAWGKSSQDHASLNHFGVYQNIKVSGQPRFDHLKALNTALVKKALKIKSEVDGKFVITYLPSSNIKNSHEFSEKESILMYSNLIQVFDRFCNEINCCTVLIIKLHRSESISLIKSLIPENSHNIWVFKDEPIHDVLAITSVAVSQSSAAALESLVLGNPLLVTNFFNRKQFFDFNALSNVRQVFSNDEMFQALVSVHKDPKSFLSSSKMPISDIISNVGSSSAVVLKALQFYGVRGITND